MISGISGRYHRSLDILSQYLYIISNINKSMNELEIYVIKKLFRGGYWGRRLLNFDDIKNPKISRRDLAFALKLLVRDSFILMKKGDRSSVFRYSLNPKKKKEIEDIIAEEFC
ncbi:hypothetical protein GF345_03355 [Candidatus Woesearchaeota archaeon]|nr:hypothetical protein [Candidatus Woesearchaeota archaeon]